MIKLTELTKSFKTSHGIISPVENLSIEIPEGTFLGIQGKSGAGKSTLISMIAGLQRPTSGKVFINETDIFSLSDEDLSLFRNQNIGFISQEQSFLENLTVLDNVRLPAFLGKQIKNQQSDISKESVENALKLLESLGIKHFADSYPKNLSGGENHRVLIARALMNEPEIILADEPTESVDDVQTENIIELFRKLSDKGKTVIFVSHDKNSLKKCDRIIDLTSAV